MRTFQTLRPSDFLLSAQKLKHALLVPEGGSEPSIRLNPELRRITTGSLTVTKIVGGDGGDKTKDFRFTVALSDQSFGGTYGDMEFENGVASFTLKHGESKTATGLPAGITTR